MNLLCNAPKKKQKKTLIQKSIVEDIPELNELLYSTPPTSLEEEVELGQKARILL